jgi:hypothetical protein
MSENRSVQEAGAQEGRPPFQRVRRRNGRFSPYRFATRRTSFLNVSEILPVVPLRAALSSCSGTKSGSRHARIHLGNTAYRVALDRLQAFG